MPLIVSQVSVELEIWEQPVGQRDVPCVLVTG